MISISACSDSSLVPNNSKSSVPNIKAQSRKQQISKIDGQPIIKINAADLYTTHRFINYLDKLAANNGSAILSALKQKSASLKKHQTASVGVENLGSYTKGSLPTISSELRIKDSDGEMEDFVMTVQPYNPNPTQESSKQVVEGMAAEKANTYLALDPDFFYVHDNANGKEN